MTASSRSVFEELKKVLQLPERVCRAVITLNLDKPAIVEVEQFLEPLTGETSTKRYLLKEIPEDDD